MRQYNRNGGGSLSPRTLASALPHRSQPPYSLVNRGTAQTREAYRDLLIFEERLKQNSERLASQRRKYEAFLLSLILSIFILSYKSFISPSPYTLIQYLYIGLLLIGIVTLILFFATGVYSEKIAYAYKFVPQANRALRYFNIYLNTKKQPRRWSFYNPLSWLRLSSSIAATSGSSTTTSPGLSRIPSISNVSSSRNSRSRSPNSSSPLSSTSSSPTGGRNTIPLAPLPPASNPRGELIFSSKVSNVYKEGYEKYRSDWEKRRLKIELDRRERELSGVRWLASFVVPRSWVTKRRADNARDENKTANDDETKKEKLKKNASVVEGHSTNVSYAPTQSEYSDSSSVDHPPSPRQRSGLPSASTPSTSINGRGRDSTARPLLSRSRSGSSSSIASVNSSYSTTSASAIQSVSISRRSSPLRTSGGVDIPITSTSSSSRSSPTRTSFPANMYGDGVGARRNGIPMQRQVASSGSSRATTPDLIPEDEEDEYLRYRRSAKQAGEGGGGAHSHSPSSMSMSSSSISIATSSQSLLFSGSTNNRRRQYMASATSDDSLMSSSSRKLSRSEAGDGSFEGEDDEDDDSIRSSPDLSPPAREAALLELEGGNVAALSGGMKVHIPYKTGRRNEASGIDEFLAE